MLGAEAHSSELHVCVCVYVFLSSPEDILIGFRERGREGEKHQSAASHMCPDWESNL